MSVWATRTADAEIARSPLAGCTPTNPTATPTPYPHTPMPLTLMNPDLETAIFPDGPGADGWMTRSRGRQRRKFNYSSHSAARSSGGKFKEIHFLRVSDHERTSDAVRVYAGLFGNDSGAACQCLVQVVGNEPGVQ